MEKNKKNMTFRLSEESRKSLKNHCKKQKISMTEQLERIILEATSDTIYAVSCKTLRAKKPQVFVFFSIFDAEAFSKDAVQGQCEISMKKLKRPL